MGRKKANHPLIESLEIVAVAAEGKALGRWNDIVVFVPMAVPGDVVDVQVCCKRRRYMEGRIVRFVRRSPLRVEPVCEHFGVCGDASGRTCLTTNSSASSRSRSPSN